MVANVVAPRSQNYAASIGWRKSLLANPPREGNRVVPLSVDWNADSPTAKAINVDLGSVAGSTDFTVSQICALYVNNLGSEADVDFYFDDMPFKLTVPAQSMELVPVDTSSQKFVISAQSSASPDVTLIDVYNYYPYPTSIAKSEFATPVPAMAGLGLATGSSALTAAGAAGVLTGIDISLGNVLAGAGGVTDLIQLKNVAGTVTYGSWTAGFSNAQFASFIPIVQETGLVIRFSGGLAIFQTVTGTAFASGVLSANIITR